MVHIRYRGRMLRRGSRLGLVAACAAVLFVVAACGQSDGENSGDSAQAQSAEPAEQTVEENADAGASDASSSDAGGGESAEDVQGAASVGQEEYVRESECNLRRCHRGDRCAA